MTERSTAAADRPRPAHERRRGTRSAGNGDAVWPGVLAVLGVVAAWELLARSGVLDTSVIPGAGAVLSELARLAATGDYWADLWHTVSGALAGLGLVIAVGTGLALLIGLVRAVEESTWFLVEFLKPIPPIALIPLGLLLWGPAATMKIALVTFGALWPFLTQMRYGLRQTSGVALEMARSYRLTRAQRIRSVILPGAGPQIFAGLRVSLQLSIILVVVSEMVASTNGIGYYVLLSQQTFQVPETWAGTLLLGVLGYLASLAFVQVERRVLAWQVGMHAATGKELNG